MADLHPHSYSAKRLLPCPCCGGKAAFGRDSNPESVNFEGRFVFCEACDLCTTIVFPLKDDVSRELVERWNKRSNGPKLPERFMDVLKEAELQLEYLDEKQRRGSTGAVLLRVREVLREAGYESTTATKEQA
jgi:hypothetical protein